MGLCCTAVCLFGLTLCYSVLPLVKVRVVRSVNVTLGPKEERLLLTGLHCVADISCINCQTVMGWMYVSGLPLSLAASRTRGQAAPYWAPPSSCGRDGAPLRDAGASV